MAGNIGFIAAPSILLEIFAHLKTLTYPASTEQTDKPVGVYFMGAHSETANEMIEVMGAIKNGDIEFRDTGRIVGESFDIQIDVVSTVMGQTGSQAMARVEALCQVIEAGFRDQTTGLPTGITDTRVVTNYHINGYEFDPIPVDKNGWGFRLSLNLRVHTRH